MDPAAGKLKGLRDVDACRPDEFRYLGSGDFSRRNGQDKGAFLLRLFRASPRYPGKFAFQRLDLLFEIETELIDIPGFNLAERLSILEVFLLPRQDMRQFDSARIPVVTRLDHGDQVQAEQYQVVQVVLCQRLSLQVCVHQAESPESPRTAAKSADIRQIEMCSIAQDHMDDIAVPGKQHADLSPEFS